MTSPYLALVGLLGLPAAGFVFAFLGFDGTTESYVTFAVWAAFAFAFASIWSLAVRRAWPWMRSGGR